MLDADPQHIKQARKLIRQGLSESAAAETLIMYGVGALEANRCANQAMDEHTKLAGYQKQALIALALGFVGILIGLTLGGGSRAGGNAVLFGPPLMTLGAVGWLLSTFFGDLALWLVKRPFIIVVALILVSLASLAATFMLMTR